MLKIKIQKILDGVQAKENPPSDPKLSVQYRITTCEIKAHCLIYLICRILSNVFYHFPFQWQKKERKKKKGSKKGRQENGCAKDGCLRLGVLGTRGLEGRYSHALNDNVSVNAGLCVWWWSHKIIGDYKQKVCGVDRKAWPRLWCWILCWLQVV